MDIKYDPTAIGHRYELAESIVTMLNKAEFKEANNGRGERVFSRSVHNNDKLKVVVYTTIKGREVRDSGKDAIRVQLQSTCEKRVLASTNIHRRGWLLGISTRTQQKMRDMYLLGLNNAPCPHCGAPTFKSKKGRQVCADFCWKTN